MSPLVPAFRALARRTFHSPFVALNASPRVSSPSSPTPIYEKQDATSSEPHVSSSGTRTYVVSEPDPSHTPYEVPSGAYPNSASYATTGPTSTSNPDSSLIHPYGANAGARNTEGHGEMNRRGGNHDGIGFRDTAGTKPGEL